MTSRLFLSAVGCAAVLACATVANAVLLDGQSGPSVAATNELSLYQSGGGTPLFQASGISPGWQDSACLSIGPDGGDVNALALFGNVSGQLAPALQLTVTRGAGPDTGAGHSCTGFAGARQLYSGPLSSWPQESAALTDSGHVEAGRRVVYRFAITLPANAGQQYANSSAAATFAFGADPAIAPPRSECADGIDNDGDGRIDEADGGCSSGSDTSEREDLRTVDDLVLCGRRVISLISAKQIGERVLLQGVVGKAQRNSSVFVYEGRRRLGKVKPSAVDGQFTATVKAPPRKRYAKARYSARVGKARSVALKLPQDLESTSILAIHGSSTIELRGRIFGPRLERRKAVVVKRILCGRYQRVGNAMPTRRGNYRLRFAAPDAVAGLYRVETRLPVRKGSKRLKKAYARAVAITLDERSG